ncbi:hypothetical protein [Terribacillus saccharophilus]|uniref:Uncharacterized protein n=1 Tax=Terribacillus saccharophilus TaxID=361277 RepID=A0ABX4H0J8_9BACI|nr:hypothetical protein [Terribacillus saccharophilus]PAD35961.1 hypothetical protein CHH56_05920 [Terribacillus saccharophilus]PAD96989.1 hypothetical protein CHH50_06390 [Terribacillus saccharophilus]PAE00565.1 hypothetical protein CHH48_07295 [Terribacillus saccharophilus]
MTNNQVKVNRKFRNEFGQIVSNFAEGTLIDGGSLLMVVEGGEEITFYPATNIQDGTVTLEADCNELFALLFTTLDEKADMLAKVIGSGASLADFIRAGIKLTQQRIEGSAE